MKDEFRYGGEETNIKAPYSRHYESKSVAAEMYDQSWVGWTYWYGGGKHGCPSEIDWIENAYEVTFTEQVITRLERTFTKVDTNICT
jgi:hypothetical protein